MNSFFHCCLFGSLWKSNIVQFNGQSCWGTLSFSFTFARLIKTLLTNVLKSPFVFEFASWPQCPGKPVSGQVGFMISVCLPCSGLWSSCRRCQEKLSWRRNVPNLLSRWGSHLPKGFDRRWSPPTPHLWTLDPPRCSPPTSDQGACTSRRSVFWWQDDLGLCLLRACSVTRLWVFAETVRISFGFQITISASDPTAMRPVRTHTLALQLEMLEP